jgi:hypothetical protein
LKSVEAEEAKRLEAARFIASLKPSAPTDDGTCKKRPRKKGMHQKALRLKNAKELLHKKSLRKMSKREKEVTPETITAETEVLNPVNNEEYDEEWYWDYEYEPHAKKLKGKIEAPETIMAETEGWDPLNNEEYDDTKPGGWYWDYVYDTWVHTGPKRVRRKNLSNRMEKNWVLGMRRNWHTENKKNMIANMTITRDKLDTVSDLNYDHRHNSILNKTVYICYV